MKITKGFFTTTIEYNEEDYKRFPQLTHYPGKNSGCLYCSSVKAPACPHHDIPLAPKTTKREGTK